MDLDLGQVGAFVAETEARSFGRAAQRLHLSQQALSKRIARLEACVGTLFVRQPGGVLLTARGVRFLPAARELLAVAETAADTARAPTPAPLRVDVWGHLHPPFALVESFATGRPDLVVHTGMRRSLPLALTALQRREIDAAFGNVALGRLFYLDGYGSYDPEVADWGGYWSKQGPELLEHRAALFDTEQRMVFGATTFREMAQIWSSDIDPNLLDEWNVRMVRMPATVVSSTLTDTLGWPDATIARGDAVEIVTRSRRTRTCRCARRAAACR